MLKIYYLWSLLCSPNDGILYEVMYFTMYMEMISLALHVAICCSCFGCLWLSFVVAEWMEQPSLFEVLSGTTQARGKVSRRARTSMFLLLPENLMFINNFTLSHLLFTVGWAAWGTGVQIAQRELDTQPAFIYCCRDMKNSLYHGWNSWYLLNCHQVVPIFSSHNSWWLSAMVLWNTVKSCKWATYFNACLAFWSRTVDMRVQCPSLPDMFSFANASLTL